MAAANGCASAALFSEEELREMSGVRRGENFVEITCGCTSHRYGDAVGRLRVYASGELEINCECTPGCREGPCQTCRLSFFSHFAGLFTLDFMSVPRSAYGVYLTFDVWVTTSYLTGEPACNASTRASALRVLGLTCFY
jgi:hypothetical protein